MTRKKIQRPKARRQGRLGNNNGESVWQYEIPIHSLKLLHLTNQKLEIIIYAETEIEFCTRLKFP